MRLSLPTGPQYVRSASMDRRPVRDYTLTRYKVRYYPVIGFVHHGDEVLPLVDQGHPTKPLLSVIILDADSDSPRTLHDGECPNPTAPEWPPM